MINEHIQSIYSAKAVTGSDGSLVPLNSEVDPQEGKFIFDLISSDSGVAKVLEVGCAYGLSALHICYAIKGRPGAEHVIIDPFQNSYWKGAGVRNLQQADCDFYRLIERGSEFALPELVSQREGGFDFAFIDGNHTFDHVLVDCFYATRLLRVGGYLVLDDATMMSISRVIDYLLSYPCYRMHAGVSSPARLSVKLRLAKLAFAILPENRREQLLHPRYQQQLFNRNTNRMVALRKVSEDQRGWDWFPVGF